MSITKYIKEFLKKDNEMLEKAKDVEKDDDKKKDDDEEVEESAGEKMVAQLEKKTGKKYSESKRQQLVDKFNSSLKEAEEEDDEDDEDKDDKDKKKKKKGDEDDEDDEDMDEAMGEDGEKVNKKVKTGAEKVKNGGKVTGSGKVGKDVADPNAGKKEKTGEDSRDDEKKLKIESKLKEAIKSGMTAEKIMELLPEVDVEMIKKVKVALGESSNISEVKIVLPTDESLVALHALGSGKVNLKPKVKTELVKKGLIEKTGKISPAGKTMLKSPEAEDKLKEIGS